jgi:hypothetical protein
MFDFVNRTQSAPEGGFAPRTGWAGTTKPAGRRLMAHSHPASIDHDGRQAIVHTAQYAQPELRGALATIFAVY